MYRKKQHIHTAIICLLLIVFHSFRTTSQNLPSEFNLLTTNDGLSDNAITDIIQDRYGFIWLATSNGLNRMMGTNLRPFYQRRIRLKPSLPVSLIACWKLKLVTSGLAPLMDWPFLIPLPNKSLRHPSPPQKFRYNVTPSACMKIPPNTISGLVQKPAY